MQLRIWQKGSEYIDRVPSQTSRPWEKRRSCRSRGSPPLAGTPERTYRRRVAKLRAGDAPAKGRWPTPAVDAAETLAAKYASDWPAWGHRTIAATMRADGHQVSTVAGR